MRRSNAERVEQPDRSALAFRRDPDARGGRRRQQCAVRAAGDRTEVLGRLAMPAVVIHGTEDQKCDSSGGPATAEAIPRARFELIEGIGHDLPRGAWPRIVRAISENARRGDERAALQA